MNRIFKPLVKSLAPFAAGLLGLTTIISATTAQATTSSYTLCSTSGCRSGGTATVSGSYAQTRYPIVFAHGMAGFSQIGPIDYWYGIPQDLTSNGAQVFVTQEASFQSSYVRGEQLLAQVNTILALTGASKVNLIGHSHGSQSIRYVAGTEPDIVASATAVGGPNTGSPVADVVEGVTTTEVVGPLAAPVVAAIVNATFAFVDLTSGNGYQQDAIGGLNSLTTKGAGLFNLSFPAGIPGTPCGQTAALQPNGVYYYSWGGTSHVTTAVDPSDALLLATSVAFAGQPNDGLVGQCSSHLGQVIRDNYNMNHLDEVNQMFGLVSIFETSPVTLFRNQANRLKLLGL